MAVSDLYLAAWRLLALVDEPARIVDWEFAVEQLRRAVDAEGEPSDPSTVQNADGSSTTSFWDGTFEVRDAAGGVTTPRGKPLPAQAPALPADQVYDDSSGLVFKTTDMTPAEPAEQPTVVPVEETAPAAPAEPAAPAAAVAEVPATDAAVAKAAELDVDIATVEPTGASGQVIVPDVVAADAELKAGENG